MVLRRVDSSSETGGQARIPDVNGRKLANAIKAGTLKPDFAAWLAYRLQIGEVLLHHLTARQARQVTGATCADLAAERRKNRRVNGNGCRVLYRRNPSDTDIDTIVARLGADRVLAALDRITTPTLSAAE